MQDDSSRFDSFIIILLNVISEAANKTNDLLAPVAAAVMSYACHASCHAFLVPSNFVYLLISVCCFIVLKEENRISSPLLNHLMLCCFCSRSSSALWWRRPETNKTQNNLLQMDWGGDEKKYELKKPTANRIHTQKALRSELFGGVQQTESHRDD